MKHIVIVSTVLVFSGSAASIDECKAKEKQYLNSVHEFNKAQYEQKKENIVLVKSNLERLLKCGEKIDIAIYKKQAKIVNRLMARYMP